MWGHQLHHALSPPNFAPNSCHSFQLVGQNEKHILQNQQVKKDKDRPRDCSKLRGRERPHNRALNPGSRDGHGALLGATGHRGLGGVFTEGD